MVCKHHAAWHRAQVLQCVPLSLWQPWSVLGAVAQWGALLALVLAVSAMPGWLLTDIGCAAWLAWSLVWLALSVEGAVGTISMAMASPSRPRRASSNTMNKDRQRRMGE